MANTETLTVSFGNNAETTTFRELATRTTSESVTRRTPASIFTNVHLLISHYSRLHQAVNS